MVKVLLKQQVPHFQLSFHALHVLFGKFLNLHTDGLASHPQLVEPGPDLFHQLYYQACGLDDVKVHDEDVVLVLLVEFAFQGVHKEVCMPQVKVLVYVGAEQVGFEIELPVVLVQR